MLLLIFTTCFIPVACLTVSLKLSAVACLSACCQLSWRASQNMILRNAFSVELHPEIQTKHLLMFADDVTDN